MNIADILFKDYLVNGPRTLRTALEREPDVIYLLGPMLRRIIVEAPLFSHGFKEEFQDELRKLDDLLAGAANAAVVVEEAEGADVVNHPPHYAEQGRIECIDAMQAMLTPEEFRGYLRGTIFKYNWRLPHKGRPLEDSQKMGWYLKRLQACLE